MKDKNNTTTGYTKENSHKINSNCENEDDFKNREECFKTKIGLIVLGLLIICIIIFITIIHYFALKLEHKEYGKCGDYKTLYQVAGNSLKTPEEKSSGVFIIKTPDKM